MNYRQYIRNLITNNDDNIYKTNKNKTCIELVEILGEEINEFNYSDEKDITYIFRMFDLLIELLGDNITLQQQLYNKFTYIHNQIKNLLHAAPENMQRKELSRYKILKNIMNKMENTMLTIYYDNPAEYDSHKEEFIEYIIFKLKYINFFRQACEKFPHIVNSTNKEGQPIAEMVLDNYLKSLDLYISKENLGPIDDLIYYDKVLAVIFENEKVKIDDFNKKLMLEKVKSYMQSKHITNQRHREKLSFFVNNVINIILRTNSTETLDYLSYMYEVHNKFHESHNLEAKTIYLNHNEPEITTKAKIYTFDGEGAKEIDDGLSVQLKDGIYHFGVHIADPGSYIPEESILYDEAKRRTTSLYMGNHCIPLYPFELSGDLMSLNEGKNTYCMSHYFDIDAATGELINYTIKNEVCRIEGNLTYDLFDNILDNGVDNQDLFEAIINLSNLSEILKRIYNEDTVYGEFHNDKNSSLSRGVVESAMIYTNYNLAKRFSDLELPFMYRSHRIEEENIKKLIKLQERLKDKTNSDQIIKTIEMMKNTLPRAYYTRKNEGHYGLGIDYYSHATSPLRRLADNVVNMCIKKFLLTNPDKEEIKIMEEKIDELSEVINSKRASLEDYEIQYMRLKKEV